jgi:glycosidase
MPRTLALVLSAVAVAACAGESSPTSPCTRDCGAHGSCIIAGGHESCLCNAGYTGDGCTACSAGFVAAGAECVADPCNPNPCTAPHQTVCAPGAGGATCSCDADAQDNDGDGTCRPTCAAALVGFGPQPCDDSSGEAIFTGPRTCATEVRYVPPSPLDAVSLPGEWNAWDKTQAMAKQADGSFTATLTLAAGSYAYKLYDPAKDAWFEDPANPYFKWVGGMRNSRLIVEDCQRPYLRLMHQPEVAGGAVTFKVQYVDGAGGAGLASGGVTVTRNGSGIGARYDAATGVLTVTDTGLAPGKVAYRFEASDAAGRAAKRLYVPVWIEERRFDWRDAVLYFAFTDRFANGDPTNDAPLAGVDTKANWQGGDFAGIRQKIEAGYFDALGVSAIWVSPVSMNTGRSGAGDFGLAAAYHGYWPISTGWTEDNALPGVEPTDPHFGSLDEFKALVQSAHAHGIRILVDFVANHVHEDSPLWTHHQSDSPAWFNPFESCEDTNYAHPITCWFAPYLPDFDYTNYLVMETVIEHARWLVEETDIDGLRVDAVKHMVDDFSYSLRGRLAERLRFSGERFYMVGETFTGEGEYDLIRRYVSPAQLDGQFDFPLYWQVLATLVREERDLKALEGMCRTNDGQYGDFAVMSTFMGNHDVCRALSHADGAFSDMWCNDGKQQGWTNPPALPTSDDPFRRIRLAWTFLLTSPGIPLIYYGDEMGFPGAGDPDNRRFMQWDGLSAPQQATLAHVEALTALRRAHPATSRGARRTLVLASDGLLWAYAMQTADDFVVVVLNRSPSPRTQEVVVAELGLADGDVLVDAVSGAELTVQGGAVSVALDGRASAVLAKR